MDALQAHYIWQLRGHYIPKVVDVLGRGLGKPVGSFEIPLATPVLLHFMNHGALEVSRGSHLSKHPGEVIQPLLLKVGPVGLVIGLPGHTHNFGLFGEGLGAGFLKGLCSQPSLFPFLARMPFRSVVRFHCFLFFLPWSWYILVQGMAPAFCACWWCWHLWHSWDGGCRCQFPVHNGPQLGSHQHPKQSS